MKPCYDDLRCARSAITERYALSIQRLGGKSALGAFVRPAPLLIGVIMSTLPPGAQTRAVADRSVPGRYPADQHGASAPPNPAQRPKTRRSGGEKGTAWRRTAPFGGMEISVKRPAPPGAGPKKAAWRRPVGWLPFRAKRAENMHKIRNLNVEHTGYRWRHRLPRLRASRDVFVRPHT